MKSVKALESDKARLQEALNLVMPEMRGMASISSTASDIVGKVDSIANALATRLPGYNAEVLGPYGLNAHVTIVLSRREHEQDSVAREKIADDNTFSITLTPIELGAAGVALGLVDESQDLGHYAPGTLGAINGGNHPVIELEAGMRITELLSSRMHFLPTKQERVYSDHHGHAVDVMYK